MEEETSVSGKWVASPRNFLIEQHVADTMTSAHWHDHIEINLLLEGAMTYLFNGKQEQVVAGRLVLFWAAIPHQTILVTPDSPLICVYLPLVDFLALPIDVTARQDVLQGAFVHQAGPSEGISASGARWVREWSGDGEARRSVAAASTSPSIRHAQALTELIGRQYSEALTLHSIAKLARIHPTTANRAFRDVFGISVMEYLTRFRLSRSMQRLAETDDPIVQIAHGSGFGSTARFYHVFKQRTGSTPRQFRMAARIR
jgi:AraC-like DNA-binding protein